VYKTRKRHELRLLGENLSDKNSEVVKGVGESGFYREKPSGDEGDQVDSYGKEVRSSSQERGGGTGTAVGA